MKTLQAIAEAASTYGTLESIQDAIDAGEGFQWDIESGIMTVQPEDEQDAGNVLTFEITSKGELEVIDLKTLNDVSDQIFWAVSAMVKRGSEASNPREHDALIVTDGTYQGWVGYVKSFDTDAFGKGWVTATLFGENLDETGFEETLPNDSVFCTST